MENKMSFSELMDEMGDANIKVKAASYAVVGGIALISYMIGKHRGRRNA
jgi:hypothetical protein